MTANTLAAAASQSGQPGQPAQAGQPAAAPQHNQFSPQSLLQNLAELVQDAPAYVRRGATALIDQIKNEWSLEDEHLPAADESGSEEDDDPL